MSNFYTQEKDFVPVQDFEHEYKIANDGRVLSLITDAYVRTSVDTHGYLIVNLYKDGKRTTARLHVLVAKHFIPNPDNLPVVNHIDGNKQNPHYTNLEWCTYSENTLHAHNTGLQKATSNKIVVRGDGTEYASLTEAANANNTTKFAISKAAHGHKKTAGGHTWTFKQ